jgi:hypothetical protein
MNQADLITGLALAAATPVPFLIQVYVCSRLRSFEGISFASLIMGNLCMSTQVVNAIMLKWKQLQYCSAAGFIACQPSMVDLYQFAAVWLSFLPLIFQVRHEHDVIMASSLVSCSSSSPTTICLRLLFLSGASPWAAHVSSSSASPSHSFFPCINLAVLLPLAMVQLRVYCPAWSTSSCRCRRLGSLGAREQVLV